VKIKKNLLSLSSPLNSLSSDIDEDEKEDEWINRTEFNRKPGLRLDLGNLTENASS
jgi:hypothetical protein